MLVSKAMEEKELTPIYEYLDYKKYITELILTFPKEGRGISSNFSNL